MNMRRYMTICEGAAPPKPALNLVALFREIGWDAFENNLSENESELEDYVDDYEDETGEEINIPRERQLERGAELLDPAFRQWCQAKVQEKTDDLAAEITNLAPDGTIMCWRSLEAPPGWDAYKQHIGVHWSRDPNKAEPFFAVGKKGYHIYRVQAKIPLTSIEWYSTVKANLSEEFGVDEDEITLTPGAPYTIVSVQRIARKRRMAEDSEEGQPRTLLTLYHGGEDSITRFDMAHASEGALFFTASPRIARAYGSVVTTVHVSPKKVAHTTPQAWLEGDDASNPDRLRADGYDLLVIKGGSDAPRGFKADIYAVLDPTIIHNLDAKRTSQDQDVLQL